MDLNKHLTRDKDNRLICNAQKLVAYVNRAFEKHHMLTITDTVETLACMEISVNEESRGFFLPAQIVMKPSETTYETINGIDFVRMVFTKGDVFMMNTSVVQNAQIAYVIFEEFVNNGRVPDFIRYDNMAFVFDIVKRITGCKLPAEHAVFEMIYAYLARDPKNSKTMWRFTDMKGDPKFYKLKDVPHITQSTTSKLVSAYLKDSIASAMVNAAEGESDLEELLRH